MIHAKRRHRRAFALPLVALLGVVSSFIIVLLLQRASTVRLALQRESDDYILHHTQAGLTEFLKWWGGAFKPNGEATFNDRTLGFDMQLPDGSRLEVRLYEAQGTLRRRTAAEDTRGMPIAPYLNRAALMLEAQGGKPASELFRDRGPARVHLASAPREVLAALARAVSKDADGNAFAAKVIEMRRQTMLNRVEELIEATSASGLTSPARDKLDACFALGCEYWRVEATAYDSLGRIAAKQGGYAVGGVAALDTSRLYSNKDWAIISWGPLTDLPPRVDVER